MSKNNSNMVAVVTMCFIFAMISFVTNMGAPFGNIWGFTYPWAGMMGNMMNFAAYLFMGIPAGNMLIIYGYKKTALIALAVGVVGLCIQYLSSIFGADIKAFEYNNQVVALNLLIYLLGAFVCGFCVCMLNTVVNPMLNILGGGGNKGNQYIQIGGTLNSLTGTLTPLLTGVLVGTLTKETTMSAVAPLLFVGIGVFAVSFFIIAKVNIPEPQAEVKEKVSITSPLKFRHTTLGVIAIFFYVGVEIGTPAELNYYISNMSFKGAAAVGGAFAAVYWFLMMCGRFLSSFISGAVSTKTQMTTVSVINISLLLIAILMSEQTTMDFCINGDSIIAKFLKLEAGENGLVEFTIPAKCILISLCGLCTSIMWGGIFNLAVEGLGKYTAPASGLFMTMVVGGGLMPLVQRQVSLNRDPITSYWVIIAMVAYILYYSLIGCKNVNKDIKVD